MLVSAILLVLLVVAIYAVVTGLRRSRTIVAKRGLSIGADLGTLSDRPRVTVRQVTVTVPGQVHLVLAPEPGADGTVAEDLGFTVSLREEEFGFGLLREWQQSGSVVGMVLPGKRLLRLRSVDSLQPLTLSRVEE